MRRFYLRVNNERLFFSIPAVGSSVSFPGFGKILGSAILRRWYSRYLVVLISFNEVLWESVQGLENALDLLQERYIIEKALTNM